MARDEQLRILFAGQESAGQQALRVVVEAGYEIAGVFTSRDADASVHRFAEHHGCTIWPAEWVRDTRAADAARDTAADLLLNVHSLYIIHPSLLELPRIGAFNLHPSALPRLAGLNSISWAIYRGEPEHGVTLHHMTPGIDEGAIAYQRTFPIDETDTPVSLMARCAEEGAAIIRELLAAAARDPREIPSVPQDLSEREYHGREVPQEGWLDWTQPAEAVLRFVRACDYHPFRSPWGHPRSRLGKHDVQIVKARHSGTASSAAPGSIRQAPNGDVQVATRDAWITLSRIRLDDQRADPETLLSLSDELVLTSRPSAVSKTYEA